MFRPIIKMILGLLLLGILAACTSGGSQEAATAELTMEATAVSLPTAPVTNSESFPVATLLVQGRPIAGTLLSYSFSTGEEYGTHGDAHLAGTQLATASFAAGDPVVIQANATAITTFRARIMHEAPLSRSWRSLKAAGDIVDGTAVFTLEQPGYGENQFLRVRLDFDSAMPGYVEYLWQLIPGSDSTPLPATPVAATGSPPPCAVPSALPTSTATPTPETMPTVDQFWEELLQQTAPETITPQADLIILGTAVSPAVSSQSGDGIVTDTPVQVECILKGVLAGATAVVREEGGCVGEECMMVSHGAQITVGQRMVLFLRHAGPEYVTQRRENGVYELQTGPDTYTVIGEDGLYVVTGDEAASTRHHYSLAELIGRVTSVKP